MLFVYAEPPHQPSVDWPLIKGSIESAFKARLPTRFELDVVEGANTKSFTDAFRGREYDILHLVCHVKVADDGTGYVIFQDIKGRSQEPISAGTLGMFLKGKDLRVIVLSACSTAAGDF